VQMTISVQSKSLKKQIPGQYYFILSQYENGHCM
jgi:hypothetical protein